MTMQCPRCSTRWRVAAASPVENPLFKCGRCHNLFRQFPGAPTPRAVSSGPHRRVAPAPTEPDTLEFIFPERQPAEIVLGEDVHSSSPGPVATGLAPAVSTVVVTTPPEASVLVGDADTAKDEEHDLGSELLVEPIADDAPILDDLDEDDAPTATTATNAHRTFRVEDTMKPPAGFDTIVRALGVAIAGFAALALIVRVAPERTSAWLSRLPIAGAGFAHDRNLTSEVELRNVQGQFQRLRNARRVFVISGEARNNSALTLERIEVAGSLYGLGGGELDQKVVTTGNRTTLTDLSEAEIVLLQRLDPAMTLAPGGTTPFLIVFLAPPRELREFSSRVLTVRPTRRASSPPLRPAGSSQDSVG